MSSGSEIKQSQTKQTKQQAKPSRPKAQAQLRPKLKPKQKKPASSKSNVSTESKNKDKHAAENKGKAQKAADSLKEALATAIDSGDLTLTPASLAKFFGIKYEIEDADKLFAKASHYQRVLLNLGDDNKASRTKCNEPGCSAECKLAPFFCDAHYSKHYLVEIKESKIAGAGMGLFAVDHDRRPVFRKNDVIDVYNGTVRLPTARAKPSSESSKQNHNYTFELDVATDNDKKSGLTFILDGASAMSCIARYANAPFIAKRLEAKSESTDSKTNQTNEIGSSAESKIGSESDESKNGDVDAMTLQANAQYIQQKKIIVLMAIADIFPGDEILVEYGDKFA